MVRSLNPELKKLEKYFDPCIGKVDDDGFITVDSQCFLKHSHAIKLPIKFKKVNGNFLIYGNYLTTLDGCPEEIIGNFNCSDNNLTSLIGGPKIVQSMYSCYMNPLISLNGLGKTDNVVLSYDSNLPLIRLIEIKNIKFVTDSANKDYKIVNAIISDHYLLWKLSTKSKKQAILDCQKELIQKGFTGNASW
jgi:hypothetical protein